MDGHFITISRLRERASRLAAGLAALGVLALLGGCTTVSGPQFAAERPVDPAMVAMYAAVEDGPVVVPAIDVRRVDPQFLRQIVTLPPQIQERPGTIVVDPSNRFLYLVQEDGQALRYGIGVGRQGFGWAGEATIHNKQEWPKWFPPVEMMARDEKAAQYADGMDGGLDNPLGARALYLWQGKQDTLYRLHGTNDPASIGKAMSSGCIRMFNQDIIDLYGRVPVGTKVVVLLSAEMVPVAAGEPVPVAPGGDRVLTVLTAPTASILPTFGHAG